MLLPSILKFLAVANLVAVSALPTNFPLNVVAWMSFHLRSIEPKSYMFVTEGVTLPATWSFDVGFAVPMPRLPET